MQLVITLIFTFKKTPLGIVADGAESR